MALQNDQIAIVHGSTPSFNELTEITFQNHAEYAQKHGYVLKTTEFLTSERTWGKIRVLQEAFANPYIHRVLWIDADAVFTNLTLSLTEHLPNEKVVMASDALGPNTGCIWLENCQEVHRLLHAIANKGHEFFAKRAWHEQSALRYFSFHPPYDKIVHYTEPTRMNSYLHQLYPQKGWIVQPPDKLGQWEAGHFILHLVALPNPLRIKILKEQILPLIKK